MAVALVTGMVGWLLFAIAAPGTSIGARRVRGSGRLGRLPIGAVVLTVDRRHAGRVIPHGFLGLGFEYQRLVAYTGGDPKAVNPVFVQLLRNLTPGQAPVLRIGGDTTDWSWWPVPGMRRPPGVSHTLTRRWVAVVRALSQSLGARLIVGINFEADSKVVAATEARALIGGLAPRSITALELGNEPELYHTFGWYRTPSGSEVPGRPADWGFPLFVREFTSIASALPAMPLAGPTTGNPSWDSQLGAFLTAEPRVRIATVHRYPLWTCSRGSRLYPTPAHLLSAEASAGLAATVGHLVRVAHDHRIPLRVDEMNVTPCANRAMMLRSSVSTALWTVDVLFEMANVGVDGVNVQTSTAATNDVFTFARIRGSWQAAVTPQYYGLLLFAKAAPAGSRLVRLLHAPRAPLHAWATQAPDGTVRVAMINDGHGPRVVAVKLSDTSGRGTLERLIAHGHRVSLDGQTFGARTSTGRLAGTEKRDVVRPHGHKYVLTLPAQSAELLTVK